MLTQLEKISVPKDAPDAKYRVLRDRLQKILESDAIQHGQRFYSNREIAHAAGVGRVTARLAIMELAKKGLVEVRAGDGVYVTKEGTLKPGASRYQVGVVLSHWDRLDSMSWNAGAVLSAMLMESVPRSMALELIPNELAENDPAAFDHRVQEAELDGLVWLHLHTQEIAPLVRWQERGLPQVVAMSGLTGLTVPMVIDDNAGAAADATRMLLDEKHARVLVVYSDFNRFRVRSRLSGVHQALKDVDVHWPKDWFVEVPTSPHPPWVDNVLDDAIERVKPDAVLMIADPFPALARACTKHGRVLGRDVRLVSFSPPPVMGILPECFTYYEPQLAKVGKLTSELWEQTCQNPASTASVVKTVELQRHEYAAMVATSSV